MPNALSSPPRTEALQGNIGDSFPDDNSSSNPLAHVDSRGPVLDIGLLDHLTPACIDGQHTERPYSALLTYMANRPAGNFLKEYSNVQIIDD